MNWLPRIVAATLLSVLAFISPPLAHAEDDTPSSWHITRYDVTADAGTDGTTTVRLDLDFDFGRDAGHGPFITLPQRQAVGGNPDLWRMTDVTFRSARSNTGAPTQVQRKTQGGMLLLQIGDPGRKVSGVQNYQIEYTVRGLIAPKQATTNLDEFNWNAIGPAWKVPIDQAKVTVNGPVPVQRVACFTGSDFDKPCTSATNAGNTASFTQRGNLGKNNKPLQVVAGFPAGTFVGAEPRFQKRYHVGNMFPATPLTVGATGVLSAAGLALVAQQVRRRGRDEVYKGLTPGLSPVAGADTKVGKASERVNAAVQFTPPKGARPGELGTLIDASADNKDVTATIIDLAVRGYLLIDQTAKKEWTFIRQTPNLPELDYERRLMVNLFGDHDRVSTRDMRDKSYASVLKETRDALYERVTRDLGWYKKSPEKVRNTVIAIGTGLILGGVALGFAFAMAGWGLVGLAGIIVGLATIALANKFPARSAEGSAVLVQTKGFEQYLTTAEADQIRFEEGIDVFSRYLPYAIIFGVAERWTKVFEKLAADGRYEADTSWYHSPYPGLWYASGLASSMDQMTSAMSSAMSSSVTAATSASSGGSGFSGGGGFGGGGGGGW